MKDLNSIISLNEKNRQKYLKEYFDDIFEKTRDILGRFNRYDSLCKFGRLLFLFKTRELSFSTHDHLYHALDVIKEHIDPLSKNLLVTTDYVSQPVREFVIASISKYDLQISIAETSDYKDEYDWYFSYLVLTVLNSIIPLLEMRINTHNELQRIKTRNPFLRYKLLKLRRGLYLR